MKSCVTYKTHQIITTLLRHCQTCVVIFSIWSLLPVIWCHNKPIIENLVAPSRVLINHEVKLVCILQSGSDSVNFKWFRDEQEIKESNTQEISLSSDISILTIKKLNAENNGNYTCKVENKNGEDRKSVLLLVKAPPKWVKEPESNVRGELGQLFVIDCQATGFPEPKTSWTKLDGSGNILPLIKQKNGSLVISQLHYEDSGIYNCLIDNGVDKLMKSVTLTVLVPARFEEKFTVVTVKKGDSASLRCEAIGDQPLSVIWKRDSKELRKVNSGRHEIFETLTPKGLKSELVLREADRIDGQLYTCATENPYGKDERNIKLLVMEVPAMPMDLKVIEIWSRSVSVTWSPPFAGNSPITKYILQYWRDSVSGGRHRLEEKAVSSAQTSALIKDLHPGTTYGIAIVAENTVGRGEPSDSVIFTSGEEEPNGAPMDVNVDVKGSSALLVTWKSPPKVEWNGKLRGYYVGYKIIPDTNHPFSFKTVDYIPGGVQEHMISNLRKDTEYSIIVKAFNAAGSGPPSQEVSVRTMGGDLPGPPVVFVVATSENSIKIQWRSPDTKSPINGHAVHYRKKGENWQRVAVTSPSDTSYTLNGLQGSSLYQLYVTATSDYGEGDPSDVVTVKTQGIHEHVVLLAGTKESPFNLDMSLLIPVLASLLAVIVVIVAVCIWVLKAKSRRNLERAIQEDKRYIYAAATQRYVDIDKTRSLPMCPDGTLLHYPASYATVGRGMGDDISEFGKDERLQEMKAFLPQNMKDRPLPKPGNRDSHIYDSAQ